MGHFRMPHVHRVFLTLTLGAMLVACGSRLHCFQSAAGFAAVELRNQPVLLLPVAVTDELGDDRTGIVLDLHSRKEAAKLACGSAADIRDDVPIMCFDDPAVVPSHAVVRDVLIQFARDVPISPERWGEVARSTGARFALLFRPEDVKASRTVTTLGVDETEKEFLNRQPSNGPMGVNPRQLVTTTRTYTLLCELVDLRTGRVARAAIRSAGGSTSTQEPPSASLQLHGIMRDLMKDLLH
jgi:hypothetical protein